MEDPKTTPDYDPDRIQDFIRAGISDLRRITGDAPAGFGTGSQLPPIPQAAQLSMFVLLITSGLEDKHTEIFAHKKRLKEHLDKVYKKAKTHWEEALTTEDTPDRKSRLHDTTVIEPYVAALAGFAGEKFGLYSLSLQDFGVSDVQMALAALIKKIASGVDRGLGIAPDGSSQITDQTADESRGDIPGPVLGALLAATIAGDAGLKNLVTPDQAKAMRVGVSIGTENAEPGKPEPAATKKLRRTLKGLAHHIRALKD